MTTMIDMVAWVVIGLFVFVLFPWALYRDYQDWLKAKDRGISWREWMGW